MYAPFIGMDVCAECKDSYAPVEGSTRCFAGFGGRVLVVEGQSMVGNKIFDPSGSVAKVYGDGSADVLAKATFPDGKTSTGGTIWSYLTDENTDDKVPQLGGPLDGAHTHRSSLLLRLCVWSVRHLLGIWASCNRHSVSACQRPHHALPSSCRLVQHPVLHRCHPGHQRGLCHHLHCGPRAHGGRAGD